MGQRAAGLREPRPPITPSPAQKASAFGGTLPSPGPAQLCVYNVQGQTVPFLNILMELLTLQLLHVKAKLSLAFGLTHFLIVFLPQKMEE